MEHNYKEILGISNRPTGKRSSVHNNNTRFDKAKEQAELLPTEIKEVVNLVNKFLEQLKMKQVKNPIIEVKHMEKGFYKNLQLNNDLKDERDIVWMKFTKDGYLGVVATSNDINFNIPPSETKYNEKCEKCERKYKYNTSGIIIHYLEKEWDDSFVLVFPLQIIPNNLNRGDIEKGIGNYLIEQGVPILDFYSHRY